MLVFINLIFLASATYRIPYTQTDTHKKILEESIRKYSPKLQMSDCEKEYCAMALEDIEEYETIISLPLADTLTYFFTSPLSVGSYDVDLKLLTSIVYHKFLAEEDSLINAAINSFPISFDASLNWTSAEMSFYHSLSLHNQTIPSHFDYNRLAAIVENSLGDQKDSLPEGIFEAETWKWAFMILETRGFAIKREDLEKSGIEIPAKYNSNKVFNTICPIVDLLNHESRNFETPAYIKFITYTGNPPTMHFQARRGSQKGTEVFNQYGSFTNFQLMTKYGFVDHECLEDTIEAKFSTFIGCWGELRDNICSYVLNVYYFNPNFLLSFTDSMTNGYPSKRIKDFTIDLVYKRPLTGMNKREQHILLSGCTGYRRFLMDLYRSNNSHSLRELRRMFAGQKESKKQLIYEFAEIERKSYYKILKLMDRAFLFLLHSSLF